MLTIRGTVTKILFSSPDGDYKVLLVKKNDNLSLIIVGEFGPEIIIGTSADFHGDMVSHQKYGTQFKTKGYHIIFNMEELQSIRLFIDIIAPNIGSERSSAIVDYFKENILTILEQNPDRLQEVPGIGSVSAQSLTKAWNENKHKWNDRRWEFSLRSFLLSIGLRERRIKKILNYFGGGGGLKAEEKIRANPYILMEIEGFGFTTVDFISRNLGLPIESPHRFKAFIQYLVTEGSAVNGHLYLEQKNILQYLESYCTSNKTTFIKKSSFTTEDLETPILELTKEGKIVNDDGKIYGANQYKYEKESARILSEIMTTPLNSTIPLSMVVEDHIKRFEEEENKILSPEQREAIFLFSREKILIITGSPGSGKTLVSKALINIAKHTGMDITCLAPTGIASKNLSRVINHNAYTIHRRLGFRGDSWVYNENNKYNTDLILLDECSMIDQEVLYRLLVALKKRTKIVFVGDHNQLPSVGPGNVLQELINSNLLPVVRFNQIFRQEEASDIIAAASRIKDGNTDLSYFKEDPKADIVFIRLKQITVIEKYIIRLAEKFKKDRRSFQIISPRRSGPIGVNSLNNALQTALNPPSSTCPEIKVKDFILRKGDRVIVKKNDYKKDIYNGDIGKITYIGSGMVFITLEDDYSFTSESPVKIPFDELGDKIHLGYALTVHNSQGLEYPYIILPFIVQFGKVMLQRNLLYTALTRAKAKVIIIGHGTAIEMAINNAQVSKRNTFLGERLLKCLQQQKKNSSSGQP